MRRRGRAGEVCPLQGSGNDVRPWTPPLRPLPILIAARLAPRLAAFQGPGLEWRVVEGRERGEPERGAAGEMLAGRELLRQHADLSHLQIWEWSETEGSKVF